MVQSFLTFVDLADNTILLLYTLHKCESRLVLAFRDNNRSMAPKHLAKQLLFPKDPWLDDFDCNMLATCVNG